MGSVGFYAQFDSYRGWRPQYESEAEWMGASLDHEGIRAFVEGHCPSDARASEYGRALLAYVGREDAREDALLSIALLKWRGTEGGGYAYEEARCAAALRLPYAALMEGGAYKAMDWRVARHVLSSLPAEKAEELFRTASPGWTAGAIALPQVPEDLARRYAVEVGADLYDTSLEVAEMWGHRGFPDGILIEFADPARPQYAPEDGSAPGKRLVPPKRCLGHRGVPGAPEGTPLESISEFIGARWARLMPS